jgi:prepilin-type N-terminal cleavage/methylation domain-containing protein
MKRVSRGFTLIELIITLTIISIVLVGTITIMLASQARGMEAQHEAAASSAAAKQVEVLRATAFDSIAVGTTSFTPSNVPALVSAQNVITTINADLKQVMITITWKEGSRNQTVTISSYINRYGINRG